MRWWRRRRTCSCRCTATETSCYRYTPLQQLAAAWSATDNCADDVSSTGDWSTVGGPQPYSLSWTYDAAGGRLSQTAHRTTSLAGDETTKYTNGVSAPTAHAHALASLARYTTGGAPLTASYSYDAAGDVIRRSASDGTSQTFTYTADGRVQTATQGAASIGYDYDADGNDLVRRDPGSTTLYLPGEEMTLDLATRKVTGTRFYQHNGTTVALRIGAGNTVFQMSDLRGTAFVQLPTTSAGVAVASVVRRHLDPFGAPLPGVPTTSSGGWLTAHGFLDKPQQAVTGLVDLGARTFDPTTGRFLSVDPVFDPANAQQDNGYSYADDNPVGMSDPDGTDPNPGYPVPNQFNYTTLHENAVKTAAQAIRYYVQQQGGDPSEVTTGRGDNQITDGNASRSGPGYSDIQYHDESNDSYYIWEVKGTNSFSVGAVARQGMSAAQTVQRYVAATQAQYPRSHVFAGPSVGVLPFSYAGSSYIDFDFLPSSRAVVYARDPQPGDRNPAPEPKTVPALDPKAVPAVPVPSMPMPTVPQVLPPGILQGGNPNPVTSAMPTPGPVPTIPGSKGGFHISGIPDLEVPQYSLSSDQMAEITVAAVLAVVAAALLLALG